MTPARTLTTMLPLRSDTARRQQRMWKVWSTLAGVAAGIGTRMLLQKAWTARTGEEPPANPATPGVAWPEALAWSAGLGVGVGVARTVAARGAAKVWTEATGELPPGFGEASPGRAW
jgi:hypothetical protein